MSVISVTKTAAKDLAEHNIRVYTITPALIERRPWFYIGKRTGPVQKSITAAGNFKCLDISKVFMLI